MFTLEDELMLQARALLTALAAELRDPGSRGQRWPQSTSARPHPRLRSPPRSAKVRKSPISAPSPTAWNASIPSPTCSPASA